MFIKSYISKNQHVFGDYQINFESDGTLLSPDIARKMEVSEIVTAKDEGHANHYSFSHVFCYNTLSHNISPFVIRIIKIRAFSRQTTLIIITL